MTRDPSGVRARRTGDPVAELAASVTPDVLQEALAEARVRAREELAQLLTRAIVEGATRGQVRAPADADEVPPAPSLRAPAAPAGDGPAPSDGDRGLYVFGITRAGPLDLADVSGMDGSPLQVVADGDLGAVVSDVPLALLSDLAEDDLSEDGRLATLVRRHDDVVRAVFERASVLPLRFGTVVPDASAARRLLAEHHDAAAQRLRGLAAHREWGVRVTHAGVDDATVPPAPPADESGTAYLSRRRTELSRASRAQAAAREAAERVEAAVADHASELARLHGRSRDVLLELACLVPVAREEDFHGVVTALRSELEAEGVQVETTGPWPPYSFATLDVEAARGA